MIIIDFIIYLLKFTLVSCIQSFSFVYYFVVAKNINERKLAIKEGVTSITYVGGVILIVLGNWEIGVFLVLSAITFANYYIHQE